MSIFEKWSDDDFVDLISSELAIEMNDQLAQCEAIADYRSEQQAERMGLWEQQH